MDELLNQLRQFVTANPKRCFFQPAASAAAIAAAESALGLPLPPDYKKFLAVFDGGFISLCGDSDEEDWVEADARWNSNALSSLEQLVTDYTELQTIWKLDMNWEGPWPYIPFCHTDGQEQLVFGTPSAKGEWPVLDAFHESQPEDWSVLYPNFDALLSAYLAGDGQINTIAE